MTKLGEAILEKKAMAAEEAYPGTLTRALPTKPTFHEHDRKYEKIVRRGGTEMTGSRSRRRLNFSRPSLYPIPYGLLIRF